jgi:hypothetical protein
MTPAMEMQARRVFVHKQEISDVPRGMALKGGMAVRKIGHCRPDAVASDLISP